MLGSTRKVLITGGSGFLGKHIAKMLLEKKYSVTNLINSTSSSELTEYDAYSEFCYNEFDKNIDANDLTQQNVVVDKSSLDLLKGSEIDFAEELIGSSFKISNPKTKSSCGCGISFSF